MHTHTRTRPCPRAYRFDESSVARPSSTEARLLTAPSSTFHHLPSPSSTASGLLYMAHTWHIHGNASVVAFAPSIARTTSTALATADTDAHVDEVVRLVCSLTCMHAHRRRVSCASHTSMPYKHAHVQQHAHAQQHAHGHYMAIAWSCMHARMHRCVLSSSRRSHLTAWPPCRRSPAPRHGRRRRGWCGTIELTTRHATPQRW